MTILPRKATRSRKVTAGHVLPPLYDEDDLTPWLHQDSKAALMRIAGLTISQKEGGFSSAMTEFLAEHSVSVEQEDFVERAFRLFSNAQRNFGRPNYSLIEHRSRLTSVAASYDLYLSVRDIPEVEKVEADLCCFVGAVITRPGLNSLLHFCLRACNYYRPRVPGSTTTPNQYWNRDGLVIRYLMRKGVGPSEMVRFAKQPNQSPNGWANAQVEYERSAGRMASRGVPATTRKAMEAKPESKAGPDRCDLTFFTGPENNGCKSRQERFVIDHALTVEMLRKVLQLAGALPESSV